MKKKSTTLTLSLLLFPVTAFAFTSSDLEGHWAMKPLNNGVANVISFDGKGGLTLHPFECTAGGKFKKSGSKEKFEYGISDSSIHLSSSGEPVEEMKVSNFGDGEMTAMEVGAGLTFTYVKVNQAKPVCPPQ